MAASNRMQGNDVLAAAVRQFQAELKPTENARLLAHSSKPDATSILTFTAEVDSINAHRRSRCVSSRLFGVLQSVQGFSNIADTFVSAHPDIAALVWGCVKFTILTVNNVTSFFDKLSACFLRLGSHCPRYSEYQLLFQDSPRIQDALCVFYATVVDFCAKAIKVMNAPGSTLAKAVFRPFEKEFGQLEIKLGEQNDEIKEEIALAAEKAAAKEREDAKKHRISGLVFRSELTQLSKEARDKTLTRDQRKAEAQRLKLLEKLSSHDYVTPLKRIRRKRYRTTSSWMSENKRFKDWLNDTRSNTFWLSGILGSGKSVVCAATLDHLLCMPRSGNDHIAFFFCQFDNTDSLIARTILGALIRQCLSADTLSQTIEAKLIEVLKGACPDAEDLEEIFLDVARTSKTIKIVIDGLDECSRPTRMVILKVLHRLISSSQSIVKVFLSSRDSLIGDIAAVFDTCQQLAMGCEEARADISLYVKGTIKEKIEANELEVGSVELAQDICDALIQGSNGMFLWVAFQIEDICKQKSDAEIRHSLKTLPKDLPETYQRVLSRINKECNQKLADIVFRWVATAKRPLRLEELREAITVFPGDEFLNRERLVNNADSIIPSCGGLIVSDEEDIVVQFVHHTVQEFLLSEEHQSVTDHFHFTLSEVDRMAGETCVTYLHFNDFKRQLMPRQRLLPAIQPSNLLASTISNGQGRVAEYGQKFARIVVKRSKTRFDILQHLDTIAGSERDNTLQLQTQYAFLAYAKPFWLFHTKAFSQLTPSMMSLWRELVVTNHQVASNPWLGEDGNPSKDAILDYIVEENHCALIDCLLYDSTREIEIKRADIYDLLFRASEKGTLTIVNYILNKQLPPQIHELSPREKGIALGWAAKEGHMDVVDTLLAAGADVNEGSSTALQRAVEPGRLEMIEKLLRAGSDVNAPAGTHGLTALQLAAKFGSIEILERLLIAGANVNAPAIGYSGATALQIATLNGHQELVRRLLSCHADVNAAPAKPGGYTVMEAAERCGNMNVIETLLKPLGLIQIHITEARGLLYKSSYVRILIGGIEKVRTVTVSNTTNPKWYENLYLPSFYTTTEVVVELIGQDNLSRDQIISHTNLTHDLANKSEKKPLSSSISIKPGDLYVVWVYPCLTSEYIPDQKEDEVRSDASFKSAVDFMPLPSLDNPMISPEELIKFETGFILMRLMTLTCTLARPNVQLQILVDDMLFPSYSTTLATRSSQINKVGHCFIRELDFSKITFRLRKEGEEYDVDNEGVLAGFSSNTLDLLKQCLNNPTTLNFKGKNGIVSEIKVSMDYIPIKMEIDPTESINNMGQLRVDVLDASDLPSADRNGYSDPYCLFELDGQTVFKTKVQKKTLHPAWNEFFEFDIRSRTSAIFMVNVYNWNFAEKPDWLGSADINIQLLEPFKVQEFKCLLDGKSGSIRLRLLFKPNYVTRTHRRQ